MTFSYYIYRVFWLALRYFRLSIHFAILVVILIKKRQLFWILNSGDLCLASFQAKLRRLSKDNEIKIDWSDINFHSSKIQKYPLLSSTFISLVCTFAVIVLMYYPFVFLTILSIEKVPPNPFLSFFFAKKVFTDS